IAAWSLPFAFGVDAYWVGQPTGAETEAVTSAFRPAGSVEAGELGFGYLMRWDAIDSVRAAVALLGRGLVVKSSMKEFTLDGRAWKRGTIVIPKGGNPENLGPILADVAHETGASFVPARTGMTEKGIDLGSDSVVRLLKPRLCLVCGDGISATSYGAAR